MRRIHERYPELGHLLAELPPLHRRVEFHHVLRGLVGAAPKDVLVGAVLPRERDERAPQVVDPAVLDAERPQVPEEALPGVVLVAHLPGRRVTALPLRRRRGRQDQIVWLGCAAHRLGEAADPPPEDGRQGRVDRSSCRRSISTHARGRSR